MGIMQALRSRDDADSSEGRAPSQDSPPAATDLPPGWVPCSCGGIDYWQDAAGRLHCEVCDPPLTRSLVVRCFALAGDSLVAVELGSRENQPREVPPARKPQHPLPCKRHCRDCFNRPDMWREVATGKKGGRVKVECKTCGRFIGNR